VHREAKRLGDELDLAGAEIEPGLHVGAWDDEGRGKPSRNRAVHIACDKSQHLRVTLEDLAQRASIGDGQADLIPRFDLGREGRVGRGPPPGPVGITAYWARAWHGGWQSPTPIASRARRPTAGLVTDVPDGPHLRAGDVKSFTFGFADQDPGMTAEQIATFERVLDEVGARYRAVVYEGARDGYTMADQPAFDEAARERHFHELRALLERTVG